MARVMRDRDMTTRRKHGALRSERHRPRFAIVMAVASGVLGFAGCAGPESTPGASSADGSLADMKPVTLTFTSNVPQAGALGQAQTFFGEEVERRTGGKIKVDNFFSGELMPGPEVLAGVGSGAASIGFVTPFYNPTETPITTWLEGLGNEVPKTIPNALMVATAAAQEMFLTNELLNAEFERHNTKVLSVASTGPYRLACTEPVTTLADAKGVTVRSQSDIWNGELKAMGMVPVGLALTEVYEGMQRGVVDCWASTEASFLDEGVMELVTDFTPVAMSAPVDSAIFIMNQDEWNALPEEAQMIVQQTMEAATWRWIGNQLDARVELAEMDDVTWRDPRALNEVIASHQQERVKRLLETAPASLSDPQSFVEEYRDLLTAYEDVLSDSTGAHPHEFDPESIRQAFRALADFDMEAYLEAVAERRNK